VRERLVEGSSEAAGRASGVARFSLMVESPGGH
jgi:hypothetical protein